MSEFNPWQVESLEEFLYFCCPECSNKSQNRELFVHHALLHHPKSQIFLENLEEIFSDEDTNFEIEDSKFEIENTNLEIEDSKIEIEDSKQEIEESKIEIENSDFEIQNSNLTQCYYCGENVTENQIKTHMTENHGLYQKGMHGEPRPIQCQHCR